jgi:hypothetical protein
MEVMTSNIYVFRCGLRVRVILVTIVREIAFVIKMIHQALVVIIFANHMILIVLRIGIRQKDVQTGD